jgi:hypothetical protein
MVPSESNKLCFSYANQVVYVQNKITLTILYPFGARVVALDDSLPYETSCFVICMYM